MGAACPCAEGLELGEALTSGAQPVWQQQRLSTVSGVSMAGMRTSVAANKPFSVFDKTYKACQDAFPAAAQQAILRSACDLNAFTCEQVVKFVELQSFAGDAVKTAEIFTDARGGCGCITDPENSEQIIQMMEGKYQLLDGNDVNRLREKLQACTPAEYIEAPPVLELPNTGLRTDNEMNDLLGRMEAAGLFAKNKMEVVRKEIELRKEQFSGPQLVRVIDAFPFSGEKADLILFLEQYVTALNCLQVIDIVKPIAFVQDRNKALEALKGNIIDGQNKGDIVAAYSAFSGEKAEAEEILRDVGPGFPPRNNPVFGFVKGNPVILVVDESGSMDARFNLGDSTYTRREYCHQELENVLKCLPRSTSFNVIPYHSNVAKVFPEPVPVTDDNIATAMRMVRSFGSGTTNSMDALRQAYDADLTSESQIYFLTDGSPNGGAAAILGQIDNFDKGRNIPVNSIAFIMPGGDPVARQFMKDLATRTGGFFRAVEEDPDGDNVQEDPNGGGFDVSMDMGGGKGQGGGFNVSMDMGKGSRGSMQSQQGGGYDANMQEAMCIAQQARERASMQSQQGGGFNVSMDMGKAGFDGGKGGFNVSMDMGKGEGFGLSMGGGDMGQGGGFNVSMDMGKGGFNGGKHSRGSMQSQQGGGYDAKRGSMQSGPRGSAQSGKGGGFDVSMDMGGSMGQGGGFNVSMDMDGGKGSRGSMQSQQGGGFNVSMDMGKGEGFGFSMSNAQDPRGSIQSQSGPRGSVQSGKGGGFDVSMDMGKGGFDGGKGSRGSMQSQQGGGFNVSMDMGKSEGFGFSMGGGHMGQGGGFNVSMDMGKGGFDDGKGSRGSMQSQQGGGYDANMQEAMSIAQNVRERSSMQFSR